MKELLIAAKIFKCAKTVVVPVDYIYELNFAKTFNNGINRNQIHLMFYSNDPTKKPNFQLPVSDEFDASTDSCFDVKLLRAFCEYILN